MTRSPLHRRQFSRVAAAGLALLTVYAVPAYTDTVSPLDATIADVQKHWPDIAHVPGDDVAKLMRDGSAVVFDVRTPEEYAVSHLEGAINVDPGLTAAAFLSRYADATKGKAAVFYCSVGVRSSKLAQRVTPGLKVAGVSNVVNLKGGIFYWHGENRPLVDGRGPTDLVHGYDSSWGKLVKRQDKVQDTVPDKAQDQPGK